MVEVNFSEVEGEKIAEDENDKGLMHLIKKKYLWIMILIIGVAAFLPSYLQGTALWVSYIFLALLIGSCYTMYQNLYYFQQFSFKHRPFLMTRYFQLTALAGVVSLMIYTLPIARESGEWVPYIILRIIALLIPYQFYSIFQIAKHHKKEDPTRCEFC